MMPSRPSLFVGVVFALLMSPFLAAPASAADVSKNLYMSGSVFHADSASGAPAPTIVIAPGDRLLLRIENLDTSPSTFHTFTFPHFGIDQGVSAGEVVFVNVTTTSGDAGKWQFWCDPHSVGPNPESHTGMVGWVDVRTPPRPTPGFEAFAALTALIAAFVMVAVRRRT